MFHDETAEDIKFSSPKTVSPLDDHQENKSTGPSDDHQGSKSTAGSIRRSPGKSTCPSDHHQGSLQVHQTIHQGSLQVHQTITREAHSSKDYRSISQSRKSSNLQAQVHPAFKCKEVVPHLPLRVSLSPLRSRTYQILQAGAEGISCMVNGCVMFEFRTWYAVYHSRSTFRMAIVLYHRHGTALTNALLCKPHDLNGQRD